MDKKMFLPLLLLAALFLTGCGYAAPEKAVRQEMDRIQKLDESTIKAFVSYEDIRLSQSAPLEIGSETTEAIRLFFQNFKYRIRSSSVSSDGQTATVELNITNLDAKMLAKDLCRSMIQASTSQEGEEEPESLVSSFALMKKCLEENDYPLVTTAATVHLSRQNGEWIIPEDSRLEDQLAGGLVSYLRDPYLLPPDDVLECTLAPFADFTAEQWIRYLKLDDVFDTGSDLAGEIDAALAQQIARFFSYEITDVSQNGDYAAAQVTISSLDLSKVLSGCRQSLLDYAETTASIRATDAEIRQKAAEYLLSALQTNEDSVENTLTIHLSNNGYSWTVLMDETFADALLGGVDVAVDSLYPIE